MTEQHPPQSFFDKLQATVTMRPRWRFWFDHVAVVAAIIFVAVGLVYLGSFMSFLWRSSHLSALPTFGREGYGVFARVFPWWHLGFVLLGLGAFFYLLRRHTYLYRWPLAVTLGVFLVAFAVAALATDTTRLHDRLTNQSLEGERMPFLGALYSGRADMARGIVTPGTITQLGENEIRMNVDDGSVRVQITDDTMIDPNWVPRVGEEIVVLGKRKGEAITALGIHPANTLPNRRPFRPFHGAPAGTF